MSLAWSASAGATSYHVKRSTTSGGPYTQISAPTATNFTDTGLTNGTTYYYVVRAIESGFESADSLNVQVAPAARACSTGNAVVLENCMPGSANWPAKSVTTVSGGGIEGYATAQSINKGESIDFKVNASAGAPYTIEIYRSGDAGAHWSRLPVSVRFPDITTAPGANPAKRVLQIDASVQQPDHLGTDGPAAQQRYLHRLRHLSPHVQSQQVVHGLPADDNP